MFIFPNPLNPKKYVVINSGFTFHDQSNNDMQSPKLPDWAVVDITKPGNNYRYLPLFVESQGFFDEAWKLKAAGEAMRRQNDSRMMFPLDLRFKLLAIASQISVTDAQGRLIYYVKQKAFKLKEAVTVFADEGQTRPVYRISADRVIDISANYRIEDAGGAEVGTLQRHGMRSFWKVHYEIHQPGQPGFVIREENPWVKVMDSVLGEIPIVSLLTGYMFHPAYLLSRGEGQPALLRVVKRAGVVRRPVRVEAFPAADGPWVDLAVVGLLMMLLVERGRGIVQSVRGLPGD